MAEVDAACVHWPLLQQPEQVVGPHAVPPEQTPAVHVPRGSHVVHVAPLTPQASVVWLVGARQPPFEQQPAHEKKSHAGSAVQVPIVHELFIGQTLHAWPPAPHWVAFCEPKGTQRLP